MNTEMNKEIYKKNPRSKVIDLEDEGVLFIENSTEEKLIANTTAMAIWDLIDGKRTVEDITKTIANASNTAVEEIASDIARQIIEFAELRLIEK